MKTVTMNIALNEDLKAHIDRRVREGAYTSTSEYVRHLVRLDKAAAATGELRDLIREGAESAAGPTHHEVMQELRARYA